MRGLPNSGLYTMTVNRIDGTIHFNVRTATLPELTKQTFVMVARDEDSKNDWYIRFTDKEAGLLATRLSWRRRASGSLDGLRTYNRTAAGTLLDSVKATYSATFIISANTTTMPDGTVWRRILTANPIRKK